MPRHDVPCRFFRRGYCRNGDNCQWVHDGGGDAQIQDIESDSSSETSNDSEMYVHFF